MSKWNFYLALLSVVFVGCQSEPPGERSGKTEASQVVSENQQPEIDAAQAPLVAPADVAITVDSPTQKDPVNVGMALGRASVASHEQVLLVLRVHVAEGWHIYAAAGPTGVGTPTKLELTLPQGVSMSGEWQLPQAEIKPSSFGPVGMYHGELLFSVPLKVSAKTSAGTDQIICAVSYQPCTDSQCLRPTKEQISIPVTITSN